MGIAIASSGLQAVAWAKFSKMMICWVFHPIIGLVLCMLFIKVLYPPFNKFIKSEVVRNMLLKIGFIVFGCYGAYALGANNVVVTTSSYYQAGMFGMVGKTSAAFWAATLGGLSIALGALTYGGRVMVTIGKKITPLEPFSALMVVLVHSLTLHFFTQLNVPVSSSHAVVGAVIGAGLLHGAKTVNKRTLAKIFVGWIITPLVAAALAYFIALLIISMGY
jgi:PiT family inorganic phosphate transporter